MPESANRTAVDASSIETDSRYNCFATCRSFKKSLWRTWTIEAWRAIGEEYLRGARMKTNEYRVRSKKDGVANTIVTGWHIENTICRDCLADRLRVVSHAIALGAEIAQICPSLVRRKSTKGGGKCPWNRVYFCSVEYRMDRADIADMVN